MDKSVEKPYSVIATIEAKKPSMLRMVLKDVSMPNTVYIDRIFPSKNKTFVGVQKFEFNMPYSYPHAVLEVTDISGNNNEIKILETKRTKLKQFSLKDIDQTTKNFVLFAIDFCLKAGDLKANKVYFDSNNKIFIKYLDQLINYDTGQKIETPARYETNNSYIEINATDFKKNTVCRRLMILMHEYFHSIYHTKNLNHLDEEIACDLAATKICLMLGFSSIECLYAFAKLFEYNMNRVHWLIKDQEFRVEQIHKFITNWDKQNNLV